MNNLKLGELIVGEQQRDAVHMAVVPVVAGESNLVPGMHVSLDSSGQAVRHVGPDCPKWDPVGVIDPFLKVQHIQKGERIWLFLYPGSITSLRHEWAHPAFPTSGLPTLPPEPEEVLETEKDRAIKFLQDIAQRCGVSYDRLISAVERDDYINMGENEGYKQILEGETYQQFDKACEIVLGKTGSYPFSCSC